RRLGRLDAGGREGRPGRLGAAGRRPPGGRERRRHAVLRCRRFPPGRQRGRFTHGEMTMPKVRVACFGMTLDGFSAGANQSLQNPLGVHGPEMMDWFFPTDVFQKMHGTGAGETGVDNDMARRSFENVGAWILGRNMFGPVRGPWPDESWKGWWGDEPSYHVPTFVLTHHPRASLEMKGGTTFHFVTGGIHEALARAKEAAGGKDVRIGGGASTVRQYLK